MRTIVDTGSHGEYLHYGMPLTLVTVLDGQGKVNVSTNASISPLPGDTARLVIGVLKDNLTNQLIAEHKEFVVNLLTPDMWKVARYCGYNSGTDHDKLAECELTTLPAKKVKTPLISQCPLNIECIVEDVKPLDDLDLFIARIAAIEVDEEWANGRGGVDLQKFQPMLYAFGFAFSRGERIGPSAF